MGRRLLEHVRVLQQFMGVTRDADLQRPAPHTGDICPARQADPHSRLQSPPGLLLSASGQHGSRCRAPSGCCRPLLRRSCHRLGLQAPLQHLHPLQATSLICRATCSQHLCAKWQVHQQCAERHDLSCCSAHEPHATMTTKHRNGSSSVQGTGEAAALAALSPVLLGSGCDCLTFTCADGWQLRPDDRV